MASYSVDGSTMLSPPFIMGHAVPSLSRSLASCPFLARRIQFPAAAGRADEREIFFSSGTAARHEFHRVRWFPSLSSGRAFSPLETHCSSPCRRLRFRKRNGIPLCLPRRRKIVFHAVIYNAVGSVLSNSRNACFFLETRPSFELFSIGAIKYFQRREFSPRAPGSGENFHFG